MNLYEPNDSGHTLSAEDIQMLVLDEFLTANSLRGFFRKQDLLDFLGDGTNGCVGIRIYNIIPTNGNAKIIAAKVKADGFEIDDQYLESWDAISSDHHMPAKSITDKMVGRTISEATPPETQFMSFFSRVEMLELLNGTIDGIGFCQLSFKTFSDTVLSQTSQILVDHKRETSTHLAVPMNLVNNAIPIAAFTQASTNRASLKPCPGHCVKKTPRALRTGVRFPAKGTANSISTDPYLFKWHDYDKEED